MTKIIPSIYKIDGLKVIPYVETGRDYKGSMAHEIINTRHQDYIEKYESSSKRFTLISSQDVGEYKVAIYGTPNTANPHKWKNLFPEELPNLQVMYPNLAAFFSRGKECYAISSGMGHTLFEQFIDVNFPLDVAQRIMSPKLTATAERDVSGALYGRTEQYRNAQRIVPSQNLGKIWQVIKGDITDEIKANAEFEAIFEPDRSRIGVEAGSSIMIRRSIEISKFDALLEWLVKISKQRLTPAQKESFRFLSGLREISSRKNRKLIEDLKMEVAKDIRACLATSQLIDYDFSHKNFMLYQAASEYSIDVKSSEYTWTTMPKSDEVFEQLLSDGLIDMTDDATVLDSLEKIGFFAEGNSPIDSTRASILNHLHGEVTHGSNHYFLIDTKFYLAQDSFLKSVKQDFKSLLEGSHFKNDTSLRLKPFATGSQSEGDYNNSFTDEPNWIVGDKQLMENVEISDLIHWSDTHIFIIHNKIGFGASVRDVCSQVRLSMEVIDRVIDASDSALLGEYYDKIRNSKAYESKTLPINRQDFIDKVLQTDKSNIVYVIGYGRNVAVTTRSRSSIAKFESIKLCKSDSRKYSFNLKVVHIQR